MGDNGTGTRVVHCRREKYDVYIGRPSVWGNPYALKRGATDEQRDECLELYRRYLDSVPDLVMKARSELRGKVLGCWCAPKRCHGDVLAELMETN